MKFQVDPFIVFHEWVYIQPDAADDGVWECKNCGSHCDTLPDFNSTERQGFLANSVGFKTLFGILEDCNAQIAFQIMES